MGDFCKMATTMAKRLLGNLQIQNTAFFMCDMQERFKPSISHFEDIAEVAKRLLEGSKILQIPLIVTEQYPKGLGKTIPELNIEHAELCAEKTKFSMLIPSVEEKMKAICNSDLQHIVLFGIEAHVCIQQTVLDIITKSPALLGHDVTVHVVADATSSRSQMDRLYAFERFRHAGAIVTTSEAVLLQLVGDKDHANFKQIQGLIKVSAPTSGLIPPKL